MTHRQWRCDSPKMHIVTRNDDAFHSEWGCDSPERYFLIMQMSYERVLTLDVRVDVRFPCNSQEQIEPESLTTTHEITFRMDMK